MFIINNRKIFFALSTILVVSSLVSMIYYGLNFGIDFTGGSIIEVEYESPVSVDGEDGVTVSELNSALLEKINNFTIQQTGENGVIIKTGDLGDTGRVDLLSALSINGQYKFEEKRFNQIGPTIGNELKKKAWIALIAVVFAIILFIAFAFRKVSEPVSSWKYGVIAIIALLHDIIIPAGVFAFLGSIFIDFQIDILFVMALLAILGFSVNDTIVVFDRVRENLKLNKEERNRREFDETVGMSLRQTFTRSLNTSITTLFVLLALYFIGGVATTKFALVLSIGVVAGTYSSIFLASPLLVTLEKFLKK